MRVLHLIRSNGIGGAERVLLNGLPALQKVGVQATLCIFDPEPSQENPFVEEANNRAIPIIRVEDAGPISPIQCLRLVNILRSDAFDVVHVHGYRAAIYGLPAARLVRSKIVATKHGVLSRTSRERIVEKLECVISNQMDAVVPVAEHLAESVKTHCRVLTNGIPLPHEDECAEPSVFPRRLLYVGRLSLEKNVPMLLCVLHELKSTFPTLHLSIVGDGPDRAVIEEKIRELRIDSMVTLHGFCDPQPFYRTSDILVMSSLREGLPLVALEAMASRLPVMATAVGGLPQLLTDVYPSGLLAPPHSIAQFCEQLSRLLTEPMLARTLGQNGRRTIEEEYSLGRWADHHQRMYKDIVWRHAA